MGGITRCPQVRIIASYMGGTLPFFIRRLDRTAFWFTHVEYAVLPPGDVTAILGDTAQALFGSHVVKVR